MSNLFFTTDSLKSFANKIKEYILSITSTKADISHSHSNYAESGHTHNTNYTKTETDTLLANKADSSHAHTISDVTDLKTALDSKAAKSHGTHVSYSTTAPVMDGTASAGSAATVARSDHKHPVDTSRAAKTDLDALETVVSKKANASHTHTIANVTNLQSTLDGKAASSHTHTVENISDLTATAAELNYMDGVTSNVQTQLDGKATSGHAHGLLHSDLTKTIDDTTTNSGWSMINSPYRGFILKSLRTNKTSPEWILDNYSAGIAFGGADTKGVLSHAYNSPNVRFAGGHGDTPVWNFTLKASSGQTYTLPSAGGTVALTSSNITGNAATATNVDWSGVTSKPSYYDAKAIKSITRNGTTFTYTCMDGTTGTFTQQDNNTTYSAATTGTAGLMSAADKTKLDGIATGANKITVDSAMSTTSTNPVQNKVVKAAISNIALTVTNDGVLVLSN